MSRTSTVADSRLPRGVRVWELRGLRLPPVVVVTHDLRRERRRRENLRANCAPEPVDTTAANRL